MKRYFGVPLPLLLDKPRGLVLAFALYAACFVMLAQPVFAVAVTGQASHTKTKLLNTPEM